MNFSTEKSEWFFSFCFSENYLCFVRQTLEPSVILTNWFVLRMKEIVISVIIKSGFTEQ